MKSSPSVIWSVQYSSYIRHVHRTHDSILTLCVCYKHITLICYVDYEIISHYLVKLEGPLEVTKLTNSVTVLYIFHLKTSIEGDPFFLTNAISISVKFSVCSVNYILKCNMFCVFLKSYLFLTCNIASLSVFYFTKHK